MKSKSFRFSILFRVTLLVVLGMTSVSAKEWTIPLAGNAFRTEPGPGGNAIDQRGLLRLRDSKEVYSVYFHADQKCSAQLALKGRADGEQTEIRATVAGTVLQTQLQAAPSGIYPLGEIAVEAAGYVRVDLQLGNSDRSVELSELIVTSQDETLAVDFVRNNEGNMFYWGRRGPSVHLKYEVPADTNLSYAYSEITVPAGQDIIGSYFMANGFGEGYFGIQVNSRSERRVLFSVWSPFHTDNPRDIPEADRIVTLAKGAGVSAQDFGNEGSGGQSYLVYPWQADKTYRFLTEVKPDGAGNTRYTSWFGDKEQNEWRLIASFRRPKTDKHLTGFHSFLENFSPDYGYQQRSAYYGNQWVCDVDGQWHEATGARLTADNTARARHRLDYAGGAETTRFFMKNCGFFPATVGLDQSFERQSEPSSRPEINFADLPR